jgi:3-deoxy-D-arabino-heptulosonate 7-phosphate (DAHP) synthase
MKRELNITKEEFLNAKNYIFTIANITKNGITGWNFYILNEDVTIIRE